MNPNIYEIGTVLKVRSMLGFGSIGIVTGTRKNLSQWASPDDIWIGIQWIDKCFSTWHTYGFVKKICDEQGK